MATIKSFTSLEQSRKLAEILPLESADMCYSNDGTAIKIDANSYTVRYSMWKDYVAEIIPCWSLAALLDVLPMIGKDEDTANPFIAKAPNGEYYVVYATLKKEVYNSSVYDNPIDACYEMILKLNELKML